MMLRRRWSDNDCNFGPFVYARDSRGYRPLAVVLQSGDDECPGASFRVSAFGRTVIVALPGWVFRPFRKKVFAGWDEQTKARLGRDWYWAVDRREYGISLSDGHLNILFGRQTMDSSTEQRWGCFLPWTQWRHVRRSFFGLDGEHFATLPDAQAASRLGNRERWERDREIEAATPTVAFTFRDFDGEQITATTKIEEREWRFGTGAFKWLSLFRAPKIRRSLDIRFSSEVGPRKGSWKGGTLGTGIGMSAGELHESAFRRYCTENNLNFVGSP